MGRNENYELGGVSAHIYYEVNTKLDIVRLENALNKVIENQPMLRAVIDKNGEQRILSKVPWYVIEVSDLRKFDEFQRKQYIMNKRKAMVHYVFPLNNWPMFKFEISRLSDNINILHFSLDLLIADGSSIAILLKELLAYYWNESEPKSIQNSFEEFISQFLKAKNGKTYLRDKNYWIRRMADFPLAPELPYKSKNNIINPTFNKLFFKISNIHWSVIKEKANKHNVSPNIVISTIYAKVLSYWSNQSKFGINFTISGRRKIKKDMDKIIGNFTTIMPIEISIEQSGISIFWEEVKKVRSTFNNTYKHMSYDGMEVLSLIAKHHNLTKAAVMPVVFTSLLFENAMFDSIKEVGEIVYDISQTPQVYLECRIMEVKSELWINWDFVEELFDKETINEMFEQFKRMIIQLATTDENIDNVLKLNEKDKELIDKYNKTYKEIQETTLAQLIKPSFERFKDKIAVKDNTNSLSYDELDKLSDECGM
ncbi:hypothetical protein ACETAC_01020 [Aceticella autotrophica]|uniref:Condensation domain-containing protein n=2 Tax=Aceticella autotrophica TaxID=2755338 RepID=A0A975GAW9_9THEO|nr:hypothetical protein ACETAC_01020 [Aceticella autotrophica]